LNTQLEGLQSIRHGVRLECGGGWPIRAGSDAMEHRDSKSDDRPRTGPGDGAGTPPRLSRRGGRRAGAGRRRVHDDGAILDTTVALLRRHGYGDLRVEDVATRAGVAKTTIYRRWPSKPALVAASVERLYLTQVALPDTGALRSDLFALLSNSYELIVHGPGRVFEGLIRESGQRPELVEVVTHTMHARRRFYFQAFNRAIARGEIAPETDCALAIDLLLGPLWGRLLVTGEPVDAGAASATVDVVLQGILPRPAPTEQPGAAPVAGSATRSRRPRRRGADAGG
jgi:AcrR family transcriptional regulator